MKSSNHGNSKKIAGYALPDDDEDEDGAQLPNFHNVEDDEEVNEEDEDGGMEGEDEDEEAQMEGDEEEEEEGMEDDEGVALQGGGQQIVNITSAGDGSQNKQRQNSAAAAARHQMP